MKQTVTSIFILFFLTFPFLQSCESLQGKIVKGNYEIIHEKISISDYNEINLNLPAEVIYEQISQDDPFLQITVDKNIYPYLDISVVDNRLVIKTKNDSIIQPTKFTIFTSSKNLQKVDLSGTGNLLMKRQVNSPKMNIIVAGTGSVKADSLYCENISVNIAGTGNAEIKGAATFAKFTVHGTGNIRAFDYLTEQLESAIYGTGNIEAYIHNKLKAEVRGTGSIRYKGNPESIVSDKTGTGKIVKTD